MTDDGNETVTPQQTELIVSYSAATGNDDLDVCQSNLRVSHIFIPFLVQKFRLIGNFR